MPFAHRLVRSGAALIGAALVFSACEGTGATPSFFQIKPVKSKISGQVMASMTCARTNPQSGRCISYGTSLEVQFQALHDPKTYVAVIQHGRCNGPGGAFSRVTMRTVDGERSEGIVGDTFVDEPIHKFLTAGNSAALYDRSVKRVVACGDLLTGRAF